MKQQHQKSLGTETESVERKKARVCNEQEEGDKSRIYFLVKNQSYGTFWYIDLNERDDEGHPCGQKLNAQRPPFTAYQRVAIGSCGLLIYALGGLTEESDDDTGL